MDKSRSKLSHALTQTERFSDRHIGPTTDDVGVMLDSLGFNSLEALVDDVLPEGIRLRSLFELDEELTEFQALRKLRKMAGKNKVYRSYIGTGYNDTITPPVIQRNILENPGWYTQYTPYQSEISQGRLEALLNFQTMVSELTGLPIANASLLDEATAAAEAMALSFASRSPKSSRHYFVSKDCHPQTIAVVQTRAEPLGITVDVGDENQLDFDGQPPFGILLQYPNTTGCAHDYRQLISRAKAQGIMVTMAADILSLTLLKPPGELGADVAVGSTQRFGVPLGFGGPHAAYFATLEDHKRKIPGRIIGVSKDATGRPAYRMALQTREQHIRRDRATSNICTSQVLLAIMAGMYAVYHGPAGLRRIAERIHALTVLLATGLRRMGYDVAGGSIFDTIRVSLGDQSQSGVEKAARAKGINLRFFDTQTVGISLDETTELDDVRDLLEVFDLKERGIPDMSDLCNDVELHIDPPLRRTSAYLSHPVFNSFHCETEMLRYIKKLESKDLSLTKSMIPLGSCTMKLNAASELLPISWPEFAKLHPFAPRDQARGYLELFETLERQLAECTGFDAVSLQPNSGAQGEFAGLLVIRRYHEARGEGHRKVCLIPSSAHGTNPASAVMAGFKVVVVNCDDRGNIDVSDLESKAKAHGKELAALMVTYPSTHGVFEEAITRICEIIHNYGGQVYMDGANMNAQIGLCKPGEYGPDVCHLNLHKTFCIPHGGGGPGVGPIGVKSHLAPYLPSHPLVSTGGKKGTGPISAAPWGSPGILPISLMYVWMMGAKGLTRATQVAILNANYVAKRLSAHYPVLYRGKNGLVAHECIIDLRPLKRGTGVEVEDVAKRLMDFGFHAPTISFPVPGTMMIEPTESESLAELDRFCDAMISIRAEIKAIETGSTDKSNNPLKNAPHTAETLVEDHWDRPYSRAQAVFPTQWVKENKFWPPVARVDNAYGDRNLVCTCMPLEDYVEA